MRCISIKGDKDKICILENQASTTKPTTNTVSKGETLNN
jgi:hypothetical protein